MPSVRDKVDANITSCDEIDTSKSCKLEAHGHPPETKINRAITLAICSR